MALEKFIFGALNIVLGFSAAKKRQKAEEKFKKYKATFKIISASIEQNQAMLNQVEQHIHFWENQLGMEQNYLLKSGGGKPSEIRDEIQKEINDLRTNANDNRTKYSKLNTELAQATKELEAKNKARPQLVQEINNCRSGSTKNSKRDKLKKT